MDYSSHLLQSQGIFTFNVIIMSSDADNLFFPFAGEVIDITAIFGLRKADEIGV
jgi:hypothetical protein